LTFHCIILRFSTLFDDFLHTLLPFNATHTRQLQQYTRSTNNNYTQDNLKLATIHSRQIRIQHEQKVKTHK